ncbi:MAG: hypothetical protein C4294_02625, partial [Nitrospiraceae bacterium]
VLEEALVQLLEPASARDCVQWVVIVRTTVKQTLFVEDQVFVMQGEEEAQQHGDALAQPAMAWAAAL